GGRTRSWARLHRSGRGTRKMVSGSPRPNYRHCRWWIRSWRVDHRACSNAVDPSGRCVVDLWLSRHRLFNHRDHCRAVHAKSPGRLATEWLDAERETDGPTGDARLHFIRSVEALAVVGAVADSVFEYVCRHFINLSG